jgi:hypothetical protein
MCAFRHANPFPPHSLAMREYLDPIMGLHEDAVQALLLESLPSWEVSSILVPERNKLLTHRNARTINATTFYEATTFYDSLYWSLRRRSS